MGGAGPCLDTGKVEHPFWDVQGIFHYAKVRYRGLAKNKNTERPALLLGLSNLTRARRLLPA